MNLWKKATNKYRKNQAHKAKARTCLKCMESLDIVYNDNNEALKTVCKCGVRCIREENN